MHGSRVMLFSPLLLAAAAAHADVTVNAQMDLSVAIIKAHGTTTNMTTSDKERSSTQFSCEGLMSMLCGKNEGLEIVRLDRDVVMKGDAKKKSYTETPFPTPEQRAALQERMKAAQEKLKSCPPPAHAPASTTGPDTSKCQMSEPVLKVTKGDDMLTIAGLPTHHTTVAMTQSCTNKETGDVCDMVYSMDLFLANDDIPGLAEHRAFTQRYLNKMGMDDIQSTGLPPQMGTFLAPYMEQMKKLGTESADLKGYPLKNTFKVAFGGAHCAAAADKGGGAASSGGSATDSPVGELANKAGKLLGGLFGKKKPSDAASDKPAEAGGASSAGASATPGLVTLAEFTMTTNSISTEPIPADQFEMPADWKKIIPEDKGLPEMPNCPKTGD